MIAEMQPALLDDLLSLADDVGRFDIVAIFLVEYGCITPYTV